MNKLEKYLSKIKNTNNVATIGVFDGVHIGHRYIIALMKEKRNLDEKTVVIAINNELKAPFIYKNYKKLAILRSLGVDYVININLKHIKNISAIEFLNTLKNNNVRKIYVGRDFSFGKNKIGNIEIINDNMQVTIVDDVFYCGHKVSSSLIKKEIISGNITDVTTLLKKNYFVEGIVIKGNKIGRKLGFPTANIDYKDYIIPPIGVYAGYVFHKHKKYYCLMNIGHNPTLNYSSHLSFEVFLLNFNHEIDLYNVKLTIHFTKFLRDEKRFNTKEDLINQIKLDVKKFNL